MFLGEYAQKLSGKGRTLLPIKLRQQIKGESIVLSKGFERCLFGYDLNQWEQITQKQLDESSVVNIQARDLRRYLFSGTDVSSLDQQGRFVIPSNLLDYAQIKDEVTIIGAGDHFEIWNPAEWTKKINEIEERGPDKSFNF